MDRSRAGERGGGRVGEIKSKIHRPRNYGRGISDQRVDRRRWRGGEWSEAIVDQGWRLRVEVKEFRNRSGERINSRLPRFTPHLTRPRESDFYRRGRDGKYIPMKIA